MAKELFITKGYKNKNGEKIETTYRVDADFVPTNQTQICDEFIQNYCIAQGKEGMEWLLKLRKTKIEKEDNGVRKIRDISQLEIRKAFVEKYFNHLKAKETKKKGDDKIAELENLLKGIAD